MKPFVGGRGAPEPPGSGAAVGGRRWPWLEPSGWCPEEGQGGDGVLVAAELLNDVSVRTGPVQASKWKFST